jgi:hypothetical protein
MSVSTTMIIAKISTITMSSQRATRGETSDMGGTGRATPKSDQPRKKKTARDQDHKDGYPCYGHRQEHPSRRHKGDEQAVDLEEPQTHHEDESESYKCDEAHVQPSDPYMTNNC